MITSLVDRLDYQVSARPFALFRIGISLALAIQYADIIYFRDILVAGHSPSWGTFFLVLSSIGVIASIALCIGIFTRYAALVSYLCAVAILGVAMKRLAITYALDGFLITGALICLLVPVGRSLSLDRRLGIEKRTTISNLCNVLLMVALSVAYLDAFANKMSDDLWLKGLGVWLPMTQPFAVLISFESLTESEFIARSLGYSALAFQLLFPVLIWFPALRLPLVLIGIAMHVGIALMFPCPLFGFTMIVYFLPLIPGWIFQERSTERAPIDLEKRWIDSRLPILACITVFILAFPVINARSRLHDRYWLSDEKTSLGQAERNVRWQILRLLKVIYPLTGVYPHELFLQRHWEEHSREYYFVFANENERQPIPFTRASGFSGFYAQERRWCFYCWFHYSPDPKEMATNLKPLVQLWARRNGLDLSDGEVLVYSRQTTTPIDGWRAGVLSENRNRPWNFETRLMIEED